MLERPHQALLAHLLAILFALFAAAFLCIIRANNLDFFSKYRAQICLDWRVDAGLGRAHGLWLGHTRHAQSSIPCDEEQRKYAAWLRYARHEAELRAEVQVRYRGYNGR